VYEKSPAVSAAGLRESADVVGISVAQFDRPAEAGMMVPVVMRETEHLLESLLPRRGGCQAAPIDIPKVDVFSFVVAKGKAGLVALRARQRRRETCCNC
jgi:hypothetical protein